MIRIAIVLAGALAALFAAHCHGASVTISNQIQRENKTNP
jgi:hypothetical protein